MSSAHPKDAWDKMQSAAILIASVFVPLAVAFVGSTYANAMKEAENKLRYVELAITILRAEPTRDTVALRGWAVDVLSSQSVVPLSPEVKRQLGAVPLKYPSFYEFLKTPPDPEVAEFFRRAASAARGSAAASGASGAPGK